MQLGGNHVKKRLFALGLGLTFALVLGPLGCLPNPDSSQALISAFGNSCRTAGKWTQSALSHTQGLIAVIQSIRDNDACKPYVSSLDQITATSAQIEALLSDSAFSDYRIAEETVQELTLALATAPQDSDLAKALSQQLVSAQISRIEARSKTLVGAEVQNRDRFARATLQFSNQIQSLLQNASGLQNCLRQNPEVAVELASGLLAMGGSFIAPVYGAAGAVIGQLTSLAIETTRFGPSNNALWKLYKYQMPTALGCGLETISELYCNANDAFDLLQLQAQSYPTPGDLPNPIWQSLDLEERRMPVLNGWLLSVRNGTFPSDQQEAQRQNTAWNRLNALDNYTRNIHGELNYDTRLYNAAAGNPTAQFNILVTAISNVTSLISSGPSPNPFSILNAIPDQISCWLSAGYYTGGAITVCPPNNPMQGITGQQYIATVLVPKYQPKLTDILVNYFSIFGPVQKQISLEFSQNTNQDPSPILTAALQKLPGNLSPHQILVRIRSFLKEQLTSDDGTNPQKPALLKETIEMIEKGLAIIEGKENDRLTSPEMKIRALFDTFHLQNGLSFFDNRVGNFVQWDLQSRLDKGEFPKDIREILLVAGGDIRTRLTESGVENLDSVSADLNNARTIATLNLETFREYFEPSFARSLKMLAKRAARSGEPPEGPNRPFGQTLGRLCVLLLATGSEWPSKIPWDLCSQASLSSVYPDPTGKLNLHLTKLKGALQGTNDRVRYCAYHRYLRAGRLSEVLGGPTGEVGAPVSRPSNRRMEDPFTELMYWLGLHSV